MTSFVSWSTALHDGAGQEDEGGGLGVEVDPKVLMLLMLMFWISPPVFPPKCSWILREISGDDFELAVDDHQSPYK